MRSEIEEAEKLGGRGGGKWKNAGKRGNQVQRRRKREIVREMKAVVGEGQKNIAYVGRNEILNRKK